MLSEITIGIEIIGLVKIFTNFLRRTEKRLSLQKKKNNKLKTIKNKEKYFFQTKIGKLTVEIEKKNKVRKKMLLGKLSFKLNFGKKNFLYERTKTNASKKIIIKGLR
jgi:hypothetical protein